MMPKLKKVKDKLFPVDLAPSERPLLLCGMGRSGTTWAGDVINYDETYRVLFEPFWSKEIVLAKDFPFPQYISQNDKNTEREIKAKKIIAGKVSGKWVDRDNDRFFYSKRLIKDIRCNLMLGWLKKISGGSKIILAIRHPMQVAASWIKLGWKAAEFEKVSNQPDLLRDYPELKEFKQKIKPTTQLDKIIFLWALYHYIPQKQLASKDVYVLFYENVLLDFENELERLFEYLQCDYEIEKVRLVAAKASSTNFQQRKIGNDKYHLINSWKDKFSVTEVTRCNDILNVFGLDDVYNEAGEPQYRLL